MWRGLLRLRCRWLDRYLPGERLAAGGVSQGAGADMSPVQEQSRRHLHRCDREVRPGAQRLGTGLLCGRLRQRRARRLVRQLLRAVRALSQQRQRHLHRCDGEGRADAIEDTLELRLRLSRLRPRWTSRSIRGELHRSRSKNGASAGVGALHVQGHHGGMRTSGPAGRQEHPVSQQWRWDLHGCVSRRPACGTPSATTR